jgi:hypothetical protein
METLMNHKAVYNPQIADITLSGSHKAIMTFNQLQQLVRQANVEHGIYSQKGFAFHLFEELYRFNRREAVNFLMVGVGDIFFDAPKEVVLSLVGRYFLGDLIKDDKPKYN